MIIRLKDFFNGFRTKKITGAIEAAKRLHPSSQPKQALYDWAFDDELQEKRIKWGKSNKQ